MNDWGTIGKLLAGFLPGMCCGSLALLVAIIAGGAVERRRKLRGGTVHNLAIGPINDLDFEAAKAEHEKLKEEVLKDLMH